MSTEKSERRRNDSPRVLVVDDSLASRRAGTRSYVQLHMHAPAEWTLGRAAQARQALESEFMDTVPGLHATIELLPQGLATAFEQSEAQEKTA